MGGETGGNFALNVLVERKLWSILANPETRDQKDRQTDGHTANVSGRRRAVRCAPLWLRESALWIAHVQLCIFYDSSQKNPLALAQSAITSG